MELKYIPRLQRIHAARSNLEKAKLCLKLPALRTLVLTEETDLRLAMVSFQCSGHLTVVPKEQGNGWALSSLLLVKASKMGIM